MPVDVAAGLRVCGQRWVLKHDLSQMLLLLPGIIVLPLVALIPNLRGGAVPLSQPIEQAKAASRG
ncbi:MAG: hypothetical protein U0992_16380 [Planctomycetaceae bacterium]